MAAPRSGLVALRLKPGDVINPGTLVAHVAVSEEKTEVRSDVPGTISQWLVPDGAEVQTGQPMLQVDPSPEMVWESLRALYLIGRKDDAPSVDRYARGIEGLPPQIQQQATLTARAISTRPAQ
jgi:multidrug efflux pump subunit AcrA (membrane-fusion protein)